MRHIFAVLLVLAVMGFGTPLTLARHTDPSINGVLAFVSSGPSPQQPVEQESPDFFNHSNDPYYCTHNDDGSVHPDTCVYNPTSCVWDLDDWMVSVANGLISKNTTVSGTLCQISDGLHSFGHWEGAQVLVTAPTNGLTVTLSNDFGDSWPIAPVAVGNGFEWRSCALVDRPGPFPTVDQSNGGYGFVVHYTLSITAGSRVVRSVDAVLQMGNGIYSICAS